MSVPASPIKTPAAPDSKWIPTVATLGWLIITRDRHIQDNRAEIDAVRIYGAKVVNLASDDARTTWTQLEVFMTQWRRIERLADQPGPFIYTASRTGAFRSIDLSA